MAVHGSRADLARELRKAPLLPGALQLRADVHHPTRGTPGMVAVPLRRACDEDLVGRSSDQSRRQARENLAIPFGFRPSSRASTRYRLTGCVYKLRSWLPRFTHEGSDRQAGRSGRSPGWENPAVGSTLVHVPDVTGGPLVNRPAERLRELAALGHHRQYDLVEDPECADIILFTQCHMLGSDWRMNAIREHPLAKRFPSKTFVYDERDRPWRSRPDVYVSMSVRKFDSRVQRASGYYVVSEFQHSRDTSTDLLLSLVASPTHPCRRALFGLHEPDSVVEEVRGFTFFDASSSQFEARREQRSAPRCAAGSALEPPMSLTKQPGQSRHQEPDRKGGPDTKLSGWLKALGQPEAQSAIYACVVDADARFHLDALRWFATATRMAKIPAADLMVHAISASSSDVLEYLSDQGVQVRTTDAFDAQSPTCNKISAAVALASTAIPNKLYVLTDTDVALARDPKQAHLGATVAAKVVDRANPPLDMFRDAFELARLELPRSFRVTMQGIGTELGERASTIKQPTPVGGLSPEM